MRKRWKILLGLAGRSCSPRAGADPLCRDPLLSRRSPASTAARSSAPQCRARRAAASRSADLAHLSRMVHRLFGRQLRPLPRRRQPPERLSLCARHFAASGPAYCAVNRASAASGGTGDAKVMLYTIGISFSAEMIVKGLYENSRSAGSSNGSAARAAQNDRYNAAVWQSYGRFMHETPWYRFPFGQALSGLWRTDAAGSPVRHWERRLALSLEYGVKAGYAALDRLGLGRDARPRRAAPCASSSGGDAAARRSALPQRGAAAGRPPCRRGAALRRSSPS